MLNYNGIRSLLYEKSLDILLKFLSFTKPQKQMAFQEFTKSIFPKEIVIILPDYIGDTIVTFPLIYELYSNYDPHFYFITCTESARKVLSLLPIKKTLHKMDRYKQRRQKNILSIKELWNLKKIFKSRDYNICIFSAQARFDPYQIFRYIINAHYYIGFGRKDTLDKAFTLSFNKGIKFQHISIVGKNCLPNLSNWLLCSNIVKYISESYIAIHPVSRQKEKIWPVEYTQKIIEYILKNTNLSIVLIWGPGEEDVIKYFQKYYKNNPRIYGLEKFYSFKELVYILKKASLFFGMDSGPMHLADILKTPIITLIPINKYPLWAPEYSKHYVFTYNAISDISPSEIIIKIKEFLK